MSIPMQRYPIFDVATPLRDLIFYEVVDYNLQSNRNMEYGTAHHNVQAFPNHELVHIAPNDKEGKTYRFYYAAKRENQDDYNWEIKDGKYLVRKYIIPREGYTQKKKVSETDDFWGYPEIATLDTRFPKYGFIQDDVSYADEILNGRFIVIDRIFAEPKTVQLEWSVDFECYIKITKEYIQKNVSETIPPKPQDNNNKLVEIIPGNAFHDIKVTREISCGVVTGGVLVYEKKPIPTTMDFRFPNILTDIDYAYAYAWATGTGGNTYDSDYYFAPRIVNPRRGPYEVNVRRFITNDPNHIKELHPIYAIPEEVSETIAEVWAWFRTSNRGNISKAKAGEQQLPPSIHGPIEVTWLNSDTPVPNLDRYATTSFPETPGYSAFMAQEFIVIDHRVKEMDLGLFEVSVLILDKRTAYPSLNTP